MLNWLVYLQPDRPRGTPYRWTAASRAIYHVITSFINRGDDILEFGSSTGHISYQLAKQDYKITLLDIRKETVVQTQEIFVRNSATASFIHQDIFLHNQKYDFAWNSGLIQCFEDDRKEELIANLSHITGKLLLFYPDTDHPGKIRGRDSRVVPGVEGAKEYGVSAIPQILFRYFDELYWGTLIPEKLKLSYPIQWVLARKGL